MKERPAALVVIDTKKEYIAVSEALQVGIPVIALANSDCDIETISFPIAGNDSSKGSIEFFLKKITSVYNAN